MSHCGYRFVVSQYLDAISIQDWNLPTRGISWLLQQMTKDIQLDVILDHRLLGHVRTSRNTCHIPGKHTEIS